MIRFGAGGAVRPRVRRTGASVLILLATTTALAVGLALRYHGTAAGTMLAVVLGIPALYLIWAGYREDRSAEGTEASLEGHADILAGRLYAQWQNEIKVQRLNNPCPLSIRWGPADQSLVTGWAELERLARFGPGWPEPPPPGVWAKCPSELEGEGNQLVDMLSRVPTGRLLVLGEPGSGKTILMVRLLLDMLRRRNSGDPVPVLVSVASWNPATTDLREWLIGRMSTDHPALTALVPFQGTTWAKALLDHGLIVPILDGLDEISDARRDQAIDGICNAISPGWQVILTSRTRQYWEAMRSGNGRPGIMPGIAGIELWPLDADLVGTYLLEDSGGPASKVRWAPVIAALRNRGPVAQVLSIPLMVGLTRSIYNPVPSEHARALPDPGELCALPDPAAIENYLFDAVISAAYRPLPGEPAQNGRWTAEQAERYLRFLAHFLQDTTQGLDLAWWQLAKATPRRVFGLAGGLAGALAGGLSFGLAGGFGGGLVAGLAGREFGAWLGILSVAAAGFVTGSIISRDLHPARGARWNHRRKSLAGGLAVGVAGGLAGGPAVGLASSLAVMLALGVEAIPDELSTAASPKAVLLRDRRAAVARTAAVGLAGMLAAGVKIGPAFGFRAGVVAAAGLVGGLAITALTSAWPSWVIARTWLAIRGQLPWHVMAFLDDAHKRGILRQSGSVYQFRHLELQQRFASRPCPMVRRRRTLLIG